MDMPLPFALLLIASGLALVLFGLYLFYAWLPLLFGFLGFDSGLLLGGRLFGDGVASIICGIVVGIIVASATYVLEPYRRVVVGYLGGSLVALALLGLDRSNGGIFVAVVAVCGGVAGALLAAKFLDYLVIATTACGGAALSGLGAQALLSPSAAPAAESSVAFILAVALTLIGVIFQLRHLHSWVPVAPLTNAAPADARNRSQPRRNAQ
jgi:hypothetical protein